MKSKVFLKEIVGMGKQDLQARAQSIVEELLKLRFRNASGQLEQNHRIRQLRRDLARVQTMMSSK